MVVRASRRMARRNALYFFESSTVTSRQDRPSSRQVFQSNLSDPSWAAFTRVEAASVIVFRRVRIGEPVAAARSAVRSFSGALVVSSVNSASGNSSAVTGARILEEGAGATFFGGTGVIFSEGVISTVSTVFSLPFKIPSFVYVYTLSI